MESKNSPSKESAERIGRRKFLKKAAIAAGGVALGLSGIENVGAAETPTATTGKTVTTTPDALGTAQANVATSVAQLEKRKREVAEETKVANVNATGTAVKKELDALSKPPTSTATPTGIPSPTGTPSPTSTPNLKATAEEIDRKVVKELADRKETAIAKTPSATAPPTSGGGGVNIPLPGGMEPQDLVNAGKTAVTVAVPTGIIGAGAVAYKKSPGFKAFVDGIVRRIRHPRGGGGGADGGTGAGTPPAGDPAPTT